MTCLRQEAVRALPARHVLLGEVFPIDRVELEPPKGSSFGQLASFAFGGEAKVPGISEGEVKVLRDAEGVKGVYPKLRMSFPSRAHGGKELLGHDVGSGEMIADGIDPQLVRGDVEGGACQICADTSECPKPKYCEGPVGSKGVCVEPVPVMISRYLIEIFEKSIAPTHGYPQLG